MKKGIKKTLCIISIITVLFSTVTGCAKTAGIEAGSTDAASVEAGSTATALKEAEESSVTASVSSIHKHGNVVLDISIDRMKEKDMDTGDVITVYVGDKKFDLPVGTDYTDVESGSMLCRFAQAKNTVVLAINMGSFAEETGIADKQTIEEEPGYKWDIHISTVRLSLKEKGGFKDEYTARHLELTNVREDYPELSDEEYANFRAVSVNGMKDNVLYRSSSPIRNDLGRDEYAMAAMEKAGIRSVVNLNDSVEDMKGSSPYPGSYYSTCSIINPEMNYEVDTEEFAEKVKTSVLFLIQNEPPYLIHCLAGKDRTGILCAILECFAGASADEVKNDYMITFYNFYNITLKDAAYDITLKNNLEKTLVKLLKIESLETGNLKESAEQYLISIGLTQEQLRDLGERLCW